MKKNWYFGVLGITAGVLTLSAFTSHAQVVDNRYLNETTKKKVAPKVKITPDLRPKLKDIDALPKQTECQRLIGLLLSPSSYPGKTTSPESLTVKATRITYEKVNRASGSHYRKVASTASTILGLVKRRDRVTGFYHGELIWNNAPGSDRSYRRNAVVGINFSEPGKSYNNTVIISGIRLGGAKCYPAAGGAIVLTHHSLHRESSKFYSIELMNPDWLI